MTTLMRGGDGGKGITVEGGLGGTVASIEDLDRLAGLIASAAESLGLATQSLDQVVGSLTPVVLGQAPLGTNPSVETARRGLLDAVTAVTAAAKSPRACHQDAEELLNSIEQAIEGYIKAEEQSVTQFNIVELALLYGADYRTRATAWIPKGTILGTVNSACTVGMLAEYLVPRMYAGVSRGEYLADLVRQYHPMIREALDALGLAPAIGPPSTKYVTATLAAIGLFLIRARGWGGATVRRVGTTYSTMKRSLGNLVDGVDAADWQVKHGKPSILISKVTSRTGKARKTSWVVSLPPTSVYIGDRNPFDLLSDVQAMGMGTNDIVDGLKSALKIVGAKKSEPVLLVGHSLGGITAAAAVGQADYRKDHPKTSIITLGSPITTLPVPASINALSLEHRQDTLVALGGGANAHTANHVTVTRDLALSEDRKEREAAEEDWGIAAHSRNFYRTTLEMVDKLNDPSVRAFKHAIGEILVPGAAVATTQFEVVRASLK